MFRGFFSALHGSGCRHQRLAAARRDGGSQTGWRQPDVMAAARRDGGRVKRSRRFCYLAKSPTLLTPEEASSLAVQSQPSAKKATDNHLSVASSMFPEIRAINSFCAPVYSE